MKTPRLDRIEKWLAVTICLLSAYCLFTAGMIVGEASKEKEIYDSSKIKHPVILFGAPTICLQLDSLSQQGLEFP